MRKNIVFLLLALFIVTLLYMFSRKEFPPIPSDSRHMNITDKILCLDCHGPDKAFPLKKSHPPKDQCFECHKMAKR
jgi:hypothetical protein